MNKQLKLYVWHDVLSDYTEGVMFALAYTMKEARKTILKEYYNYDSIKEELKQRPKVYTTPIGFAVWGGG